MINNLPKSLSEINLQKWIDWDIKPKKYSLDYFENEYNYYLNRYCFFSNLSIEDLDLENEELIKDIIKETSINQLNLLSELNDLSYSLYEEIFFGKQVLVIKKINFGDVVGLKTFEETNRLALILADFQDGNSMTLLELCMSYLVDKTGQKILSFESAKRLPLSIAMKVKKYIEDTIIIYNSEKQINFD